MHKVCTSSPSRLSGSIILSCRCPIECRLRRGDGPWSCRVFLRRVPAQGGPRQFGQSKEPFGDVITDKDRVEDRVGRAQLAILNPSTPARIFLQGTLDTSAPTEVSFSPDIVCLEITSPNHSDISFVDLPGAFPYSGLCRISFADGRHRPDSECGYKRQPRQY
jgi:hypothetical protein